MRLQLVENRRKKISLQRQISSLICRSWAHREHRVVTWRPKNEILPVNHDGEFWFTSVAPQSSQQTPRYWNSLGIYHNSGNLLITVEINIPTETNDRKVAGFFAEDLDTGKLYLMHDGRVGGGRPGIGKRAFFRWSGIKPVDVSTQGGKVRKGILVAPLEGSRVASNLRRFVSRVASFKAAADVGNAAIEEHHNEAEFGAYFDEPTGKRRRCQIDEIEYASRHGEIVSALEHWRNLKIKAGEKIVKNKFIELGVTLGDNLVELYEIKPNCARSELYKAIGQIIVYGHCASSSLERFLVLPLDETIPTDILSAIKSEGISILCFAMDDESVSIETV